MRIKTSFILIGIIFIMAAGAVFAESPREQLQQMVEQLQKNPSDSVLREKIIKLAQELKPAPAVPEEAIKYEGRGKFAFKIAKSNDDFLDAAKEFEQAATIAPWVADYYSDLCTIYEKAEKYADGKRNCELYLTNLTDSTLVNETKQRIAGLEYAIEKLSRQKAQGEEWLKKLDGARFVSREHIDYQGGGSADYMQIYEIRGNRALRATMTIACQGLDWCDGIGVIRWLDDNAKSDKEGYLITGHEFVIPRDDQLCRELQSRCADQMQNISEDVNKITERLTSRGVVAERIFLREK